MLKKKAMLTGNELMRLEYNRSKVAFVIDCATD